MFDTQGFSAITEGLRNELQHMIKDGWGQSIALTEEKVRQGLRRLGPSKAPGPDLIKGRVLRECSEELASIVCQLFNHSLREHSIPTLWKRSEIRPLPEANHPVELNAYRPVALTSVLVKCLERLSQLSHTLDLLQFAYRQNHSVEDAVMMVLHTTYSHLEKQCTYARNLFVDFSSAFNCMQPHNLCAKLQELQVDPHTILWILDFVLKREQLFSQEVLVGC